MAGRSVLLLIGMVLLVLQTGTNANLWMRFGGWRFERRFLAEHQVSHHHRQQHATLWLC